LRFTLRRPDPVAAACIHGMPCRDVAIGSCHRTSPTTKAMVRTTLLACAIGRPWSSDTS